MINEIVQLPGFGFALLFSIFFTLVVLYAAAEKGLISTETHIVGTVIILISYFIATMA